MLTAGGKLTGRHVLLATLGFFGLVAAVNASMIFLAVSTFSGLETENAYVRGLAYNETLRAAERQAARGWTVSFDQRQLDSQRIMLEARFLDRAGLPLDGLEVAVGFTRPTHQGHDLDLELAALGTGRYQGEAVLPLPGQWDLHIRALRDGEALYTREQRLWLR